MSGNIYSVRRLRYEDRADNLSMGIQHSPEETTLKELPIFLGEDDKRYLFKPLSKTKPFCNDLYAIAEVYCSRMIEHYFSPETPIYQLGVCDGLSEVLPYKSDKGTLVEMFTKPGERFMGFAEYFQQDGGSEASHLVKHFTNYCLMWYDFTPFFEASIFKDNPVFSDKLSSLILLSMLFENSNFHYGNAGFIVDSENNIIDVAPSYDNEFSFIFNSVENPDQQKKNLIVFYSQTGHNREANINYLLKYKKPIVDNFLETVRVMSSDTDSLRHFSDVSTLGDFLENYDSEMWEAYRLKRDGKIPEAVALEKKIKTSKSGVSLTLSDISNHIYENQLNLLNITLSVFEKNPRW